MASQCNSKHKGAMIKSTKVNPDPTKNFKTTQLRQTSVRMTLALFQTIRINFLSNYKCPLLSVSNQRTNLPRSSEAGEEYLLIRSLPCLHHKIVSIADLHHLAREILGLGVDFWGSCWCEPFPDTQAFLLGESGDGEVKKD